MREATGVLKLISTSLEAKAILAGFQCMLFASGDSATPTSPIAPDLESGATIKKGTAVVMVFTAIQCDLPPRFDQTRLGFATHTRAVARTKVTVFMQ